MTIKDIIEKLERDLEITNNLYVYNKAHHHIRSAEIDQDRLRIIKELLSWIKFNLEEEQAKYGKDEDDYFESKIAEKREG